MEDKKGTVKRYMGIIKAGYEIIEYPREDKDGRILGITMEVYEIF